MENEQVCIIKDNFNIFIDLNQINKSNLDYLKEDCEFMLSKDQQESNFVFKFINF